MADELTGSKANPSPFDPDETAHDDEPRFTVLARDTLSDHFAEMWAAARDHNGGQAMLYFQRMLIAANALPKGRPEKIESAYRRAEEIRDWRRREGK